MPDRDRGFQRQGMVAAAVAGEGQARHVGREFDVGRKLNLDGVERHVFTQR